MSAACIQGVQGPGDPEHRNGIPANHYPHGVPFFGHGSPLYSDDLAHFATPGASGSSGRFSPDRTFMT